MLKMTIGSIVLEDEILREIDRISDKYKDSDDEFDVVGEEPIIDTFKIPHMNFRVSDTKLLNILREI